MVLAAAAASTNAASTVAVASTGITVFGFSLWSIALYTIIGLALAYIWSLRARTLPGLPTYQWVPFFGNFFSLLANRHRTWDWISGIANGPMRGKHWQMSVPNSPVIIQAAPSEQITRLVLKDHFENYLVSKRRLEWTEELFGNGIFGTNGRAWMVQRKAASNIFTLRLLRDGMTPVFVEHCATVVKVLKETAKKGGSIDLQDLFFRFTMQSFCQIAFGEDLDCLTTPEQHPFARSFDAVQAGVLTRVFDLFWKFKRALNVGQEALIKKHVSIINQYAAVFIAHRREDIAQGKTREDLISHFMSWSRKSEKREMTDTELRDVIINFLVAGRDTTAVALSWFWYEMSQNPHTMKLVKAEIDSLMVDRNGTPDFEVARDMTYTEAALLESLRLHPSVPAEGRVATLPDELPDGTPVPAGVGVNYNPYVYGRSPELWGEDVLEYKPERWLAAPDPKAAATPTAESAPVSIDFDAKSTAAGASGGGNKLEFNESTHLSKHNQYKYPIFNCGLRLCMGRGLALLEAKLLIAAIVGAGIDLSELVANQNITYMITVTLMMKDGIKVKPKLIQ